MPAMDALKTWFVDFVTTPGRATEFARYVLVSGAALAIDVASYSALVWLALTGATAAGAIGFMIGLVAHYGLSSRFVFNGNQSDKSSQRLLIEYATTGVVGVAMTAGIILLTVDLIGMHPGLGKALAIGPAFVVVYMMRAALVFTSREAVDQVAG